VVNIILTGFVWTFVFFVVANAIGPMNENSYIEWKFAFKTLFMWVAAIIATLTVIFVIGVIALPTLYRISANRNAKGHLYRSIVDTDKAISDNKRAISNERTTFVTTRIWKRRLIMEAFLDRCEDAVRNDDVFYETLFPVGPKETNKCLEGVANVNTANVSLFSR